MWCVIALPAEIALPRRFPRAFFPSRPRFPRFPRLGFDFAPGAAATTASEMTASAATAKSTASLGFASGSLTAGWSLPSRKVHAASGATAVSTASSPGSTTDFSLSLRSGAVAYFPCTAIAPASIAATCSATVALRCRGVSLSTSAPDAVGVAIDAAAEVPSRDGVPTAICVLPGEAAARSIPRAREVGEAPARGDLPPTSEASQPRNSSGEIPPLLCIEQRT